MYRDHAKPVLLYLARRTFNPDLAMDLTAETFAQALASKDRYRGLSSEDERAWLLGIARHVLFRSLRRSRAESKAVRRLGMERPMLKADDAVRIVEQAELPKLRAAIADQLSALPSSQREAIKLRVVEELPYEQVAENLGISEQSARKRVSRGLAGLARTLEHLSQKSEDVS